MYFFSLYVYVLVWDIWQCGRFSNGGVESVILVIGMFQ